MISFFRNYIPTDISCYRSRYAYGDPRMGNYAYGDTRLDFPYGNIPHIMHTVSDWNIPVWTRGSHKSPYAYRDYMSCDPHMHTGISAIYMWSPYAVCIQGSKSIPVCIRGMILIPVCIQGFHVLDMACACCAFAKFWCMWKFWFNAWLEERSLTCQKLIPVRIRRVPIIIS
jgi:hypothetical protein